MKEATAEKWYKCTSRQLLVHKKEERILLHLCKCLHDIRFYMKSLFVQGYVFLLLPHLSQLYLKCASLYTMFHCMFGCCHYVCGKIAICNIGKKEKILIHITFKEGIIMDHSILSQYINKKNPFFNLHTLFIGFHF